jgi:thioesterase domain-containing protein
MLPAALVVLPAMPLSPNGKADRKALAQIAPEMGTAAPAERVAPRNALERFLARLWRDVLSTLGADDFGVHDSFFQLGGNSITGAIFINRLQQELGEIVHVVTIFDHPTIAGLSAFVAAEYPRAVERLFGAEARDGVPGFDGMKSRRVDEALIAEVSRLVHQLGPLPAEIAALPKNPPAVFVLSPPRSGSTLLRVMLGGHPSLFAPPELELLGFDSMAERRDAFPGRDAFRLEGLLRAVMEARRCGPEEAREVVEGFEREGLSTRAMYGRLQEWIGGRTLVDKTPTYAWDPEALRRAEAGFDGARYVHLVRHPLGMVKSFEEARIDQIFFHEDHPWSRREVAEALWALAQKNTLDFLAGIPAERRHTVMFEDLLRDPERVLRGLCAFLAIDYHPAMAEPYRQSSARMTDGLHAESRMLGDVKFHQHWRVEAGVAESWRQDYREDSLGEPARALAVRLGYELPPAGSWIPIPHVETAPGTPLALSFAQERLWFLEQLDPGKPTYNMVAAVRLSGALDTVALQESLSEVVRRHEGLRVTFAARSGKPVQVVQPPVRLAMPRIDLSGLSGAPDRTDPTDLTDPSDPEKEARRLVLREHYRNFDLAAGPLFRATLLILGRDEHALLLSMHHIVSDGWSLGVLVREVAALYMAFSRRRPSPLQPLPIQYADFARWQRDWLRGAVLDEQLGYWKERLAGAAPLPLPVDRQPVSEKDFHVDGVPVTVPAELTAKLKDLSRRRGTTLFMTLLAAFQALLARHTGQGDVVVATPVAGRTRAETEGLIGFFVNTLVLRVDAGAPTFGELLTRVRQVTLGAYDHQDLPFATLVEALRPERHLGSYPLAEVLFALQNHPMPALELPGMSLRPLAATEEDTEDTEDAETQANFSLTLRFWESDGALTGGLAFNTALFDRSTLERWHGHVMSVLEAVAADSELRLAELPFLSESERAQAMRRGVEAKPAEAAPAAPVAEAVAQQRTELLSRRETLSAAKRELLERRLRGKAAGGSAPASLASPRPASPTILVKLQSGSAAKRPFFCVHAIGGAVFSYAELARCMGPERPFYGLQAPGLDGGAAVGDVPGMAAAYIAAIQSVQPAGPYLLGGWSFGGVVAFEMARQLQAGGFEVGLLALLDSHAPFDGAELEERDDADLLRFALKDQAELAAAVKPEQMKPEQMKPEQVQRLLGVYKTNLQALASYRPQPYGGRITLFRPEGAPPEVRAREANGWSALSASPIDVCWVGGTHYTMLKQPEVRALAARLEACLETS